LSEAEFHNEISNNKYSLIFVASVLYERVKETYKTLKTNAEIVLIAEFGDVITDRNVSILTTPIFCLPVANFLNGVSDSFINNLNKNEAERLIAPEARILVVDDITTNLKVAKGLIQPYEIHVDLCKSGQDAIRAVETTRYDIVFMDHMMPGMDGIEATAKIRAMGDNDPYYKSLPIIALTANAVAGIKEILIKSGFDDFLSKPIDTVKLNSIIETWIPKHKLKFTTNEARSRDKILPDYDSIGAENNGINIKIEGINVDKGISTTGGIAENYIRFLSIFYKDGKLKLDEIRECLQRNNISLYVTHVHGLKSAAAIIGAEKFSADAKNLEIAGKRNDWDYINKHNHVFLSDLERLLERINDIVSKEKSIRRAEITDGEQLIKTLNNLNKAFADFDSMGMNKCVKTLREYTHVAGIGECIENIIHDHLIGQYDEAVLKIENLLRELKN
jgi:CheY-like chemotaxis protein